jgi:hypothetical protein
MIPKKLPRMNAAEVNELLDEQILCRIAFCGKQGPHIAPFQYALVDGQLYFHFADYGKKMELLEEDNLVCLEIEKYTPDLSEYRFVVASGKLRIVTETRERALAIERMVDAPKTKGLSENFLLAHGYPKGKGWYSLNPETHLVIDKLENLTGYIGLKSP